MIKNYFKTAWRSLWKNKAFSALNIAGLTIGMVGALLIFAWVQNELSYDQFHANKATLYKVWNRTRKTGNNPIGCWDVTTGAIGPALQQEFPEVKSVARVYWPTNRLFNYADKAIMATGLDVDKPFLTMFSFPLLEGNASHVLDDVNGIVLTETLARKIFGSADPVNKMVKINNQSSYKVTGVLKDLPNNTQFDFEYLVSSASNQQFKYDEARWNTNSYNTYVQLQPGTNLNRFNAKIKNLVIKHDSSTNTELFLHPISQWHLYSRFENGKVAGGQIESVRLIFTIACLILLIACINFMNLSTARSEKRAKEVGVRKVIGASRIALIRQFLAESWLIAAVAGVMALLLVQLCLPGFNQLTNKKLFINYSSPALWLFLMGFITITGLLAGSYPAFFLSSFRPVKVLKGAFKEHNAIFSPRKLLVVIQFTVAIVLIVSTLVIYRQVKYVQERDNGYAANNLVEHPINGDIGKNYEVIKNELINSGAAVGVCKTSLSVTVDGSSTSGIQWGDMSPDHMQVNFSQFATTGDFVKTVGLKLLAGRDINLTQHPGDTASVVINEAAAKAIGYKNPIGQAIYYSKVPVTIVGVIKDFIINSPYQPVGPMLVFGSKTWWYNTVSFRLNPHKPVSKSLDLAGQIFRKYNPAYPFQYYFVDEEYNEKFKDAERTGALAAVFAGLTIVISCLGLFGLAAYMAESRSKEIGIRKVLGASVQSIIQLLTREFAMLVIIAIVIATPIGWYAMNKWLQDYQYRISINWSLFALAGSVAVVIAMITVSSQALKAAMINPVKSIKAE
ncbi:FtsX-like permease family protein [Mucilaginibacter robiniae]|uniref:FtsX-like permease family protein n=1 Tax=Mucilaginibacter robiniae TaxID=2728022 RepID=A0A7L5E4W6_9SPHI|nr:ABC transporter permease [Mucilaginibacter robiniae]QJD95873.1 FtsX-like permease family protein [Mucilaginibacter robiniae]